MKHFAWLFTLPAYAASLTLTPAVIFDCSGNAGTVTVAWSGASGPVQVRLLRPAGESMTGLMGPAGSAVTGAWVTDGMTFYLVNAGGVTEASATAVVRCGGTVRTIDTGLSGGSYFPLQVGNTWVYRWNNRLVTGEYVTRTIVGTEVIGGQTYYDLVTAESGSTEPVRLRGDNSGRILQWTPGGEQEFLDPAKVRSTGSYTGPLGTFANSATLQSSSSLTFTVGRYVRGLGLVSSQSSLMTGSSGGFTDGLELVEARVDGVWLAAPAAAKLSVDVDSFEIDVTNRKAPNCALPCYFVACGLGGGAPDAPDAYRPCAHTRVQTSYTGPHAVRVQFLSSAGVVVYEVSRPVEAAEAVRYFRLPLFTQVDREPFQVLPPGAYKLVVRMTADGATLSEQTIAVKVL